MAQLLCLIGWVGHSNLHFSSPIRRKVGQSFQTKTLHSGQRVVTLFSALAASSDWGVIGSRFDHPPDRHDDANKLTPLIGKAGEPAKSLPCAAPAVAFRTQDKSNDGKMAFQTRLSASSVPQPATCVHVHVKCMICSAIASAVLVTHCTRELSGGNESPTAWERDTNSVVRTRTVECICLISDIACESNIICDLLCINQPSTTI